MPTSSAKAAADNKVVNAKASLFEAEYLTSSRPSDLEVLPDAIAYLTVVETVFDDFVFKKAKAFNSKHEPLRLRPLDINIDDAATLRVGQKLAPRQWGAYLSDKGYLTIARR